MPVADKIIRVYCTSAINSDYFVSYRHGDSIIPREDQLIRSGPFVIDTQKTRTSTLINFHMFMGTDLYSELMDNFNHPYDILPLVEMMKNKPVAYLWLYGDNPLRKIWRIEINDETVLSYDRALFEYHVDSRAAFFILKLSLASFVLFLFSMFTYTRAPRGRTTKLR